MTVRDPRRISEVLWGVADSLEPLMALLDRARRGENVSETEVSEVEWSIEDPVIQRAANDAWLSLRRLVDDEDIRATDQEYERSQREGIGFHMDELQALLRGEAPRRRRLSWFQRLLWRLR